MSHLAFLVCALCFAQFLSLEYAHSLTFFTSLVLVPQLAPTMALGFVLSQPTAVRRTASPDIITFPIPTVEPQILATMLRQTATVRQTPRPTASHTPTRSITPSRSVSRTRAPSRTPSRTPSASHRCGEILPMYTFLMNDNNIPVMLKPPKPNLPGSEELYDGRNRSESNNPETYGEFERILRPLNTMNIFLQSVDVECIGYAKSVLRKWALKRALTGPINSYGVLLHRITSGNMAIHVLKLSLHKESQIKTWFKSLLNIMIQRPVPYDNNFRMWEYRAIALTSYTTYTSYRGLQSQLDTFLRKNIDDNILTCELRGMRSVDYHSYFLFPMMDAMFILRYGYGIQPAQAYAVERVLIMLESGNYTRLERLTGKTQLTINKSMIQNHRQRWECVRNLVDCDSAFSQLTDVLALRN